MKELERALDEGIKLLSKSEDINIKSVAFGLMMQSQRIKDNLVGQQVKPTLAEGWTNIKPEYPCIFVARNDKSYNIWRIKKHHKDNTMVLLNSEFNRCKLEKLKADEYLILKKY